MQASQTLGRWFGVRPRPPRTGLAYVGVRLLVYVAALLLIVLIYGTKARGLVTAPPVALLTGLGTWYLLGDTAVDARRRVQLAAAVGLLLGELTWAVGYWAGPPLAGGLVLTLAFYVLSGVVEHGAGRALERGVVLEYVAVALIGTLVVVLAYRLWSA
jgi:uncharacterized protein DUF5656